MNFEDIDISVMTIIGIANWNINIEKMFEELPIYEYIVIPKKRGRKKKEVKEDPNKDIKEGCIVTLELGNRIRGTRLKTKKNNEKKKKDMKESKTNKIGYFRNSLTIVIYIDVKFINFKISKNGKFQFTGCKKYSHPKLCAMYTWSYIKDKQIYKFEKDTPPEILFPVVMTNIDFNLGFNVDREALDEYINLHTPYNSVFETSFGYTGVNIKKPLIIKDSKPDIDRIYLEGDTWKENYITYDDYFKRLIPKDQKKEKDQKTTTILVFHSGKIILSCLHYFYMRDEYENFLNIVKSCRNVIEEKIN
jgi:hypothetical protein